MRVLADQVDGWLKRVPKALKALARTEASIRDPLYRALDREVNFFKDILDV